MQTTAMNSLFMAAGQSESKATGKASSGLFFGTVLSGRQVAADKARQPFSVGLLKPAHPAETATQNSFLSGLERQNSRLLEGLSQIVNGGNKLTPAAQKQLQTLLGKLTLQLNQAGLDGEGLLTELDFSAVTQGLEALSESSQAGRQWLEQLQQQMMSRLDSADGAAMVRPGGGTRQQGNRPVPPEQLMERHEQGDPANLQEQIASVLEGTDPALLKGRLGRLQEQLAGIVTEERVDADRDLASLQEQIASVLESPDTATLKGRLGRLQEQLADLNQQPQVMSQDEVVQLRKELQQQIDGVAQQLRQTSEAAGQAREHSLRHNREELDPRFASLIRPKGEPNHQNDPSLGGQKSAANQENPAQSELKTAGHSHKAVEALLNQVAAKQQHQGQQGSAVPQVQGPVNPPQMAAPAPIMPMSTGQTVADSQIFDQVVTRMAGSFNGESGRMSLRLHPAELGSLKLDLQVEGQTIRANLQAQTTQVQEVLERNLPQLRQALAEQGLKIDHFQINLEQRQQSDQFADLQRHWNGGESQAAEPLELGEEEEQGVPLAHLLQNGGAGISLHV